MGLESNTSSTYINGLVATNPTSADNVGDGDNHIRLIKDVLKRSFSGITGEVSASHTALNLAATEISAATNAATASTVVKRDGSGNFSATVVTANLIGNVVGSIQGDLYASDGVAKVLENGTNGTDASFTGTVTGNASTASKIQTAITLSVSGDASGSVSFDGSADADIALTIADDSHDHTITNVDGLQAALDAKTTQSAALLAAWPVGSIYTSVSSVNPSTLFGGNWEAFGAGKVLIGIDASDTDFDTVEETGGAKTHALSIAEMPAHSHTYTLENTRGAGSPGAGNGDSSFSTPNTSTAGSGAAHNNVQPYVVVYMFKRIAD